MATPGHATLRNLFDDAPTPHIAHSPRTHHRDYYLATDGSFFGDGSGIGAIVETGEGECLFRIARADDAPDNNTAEYRALETGLEALSEHVVGPVSLGLLLDHNDLAENVNATTLGLRSDKWGTHRITVPDASRARWDAIIDHIDVFADVRAACVGSDNNPAHVLANAPEEYAHLSDQKNDHLSDTWEAPPPSRAQGHGDD